MLCPGLRVSVFLSTELNKTGLMPVWLTVGVEGLPQESEDGEGTPEGSCPWASLDLTFRMGSLALTLVFGASHA